MMGRSAAQLRDAVLAAYDRFVDEIAANLIRAGKTSANWQPAEQEQVQLALAIICDVKMTTGDYQTLLVDEWTRVMSRSAADLECHLRRQGDGEQSLDRAALVELINVISREVAARTDDERAKMGRRIDGVRRFIKEQGRADIVLQLEEIRQRKGLPKD
jgi:hypothetical protein